uniref:Uncharacterized protein n=1 Tax=Strombidium inclinatum TaxID=197538 RepID=A0A7S3IDN6_9SPIT|mmetsp:Transcript_11566/g.17462  ORF Transcript_11566/g.17462 Transcript_11566/m.17462 type:complete len:105 (+) Transcript_11566:1016-1330(+)
MMTNVEKCRDFIPQKYFDTHDYDGEDEFGRKIQVNRLEMPDGRIPLDLAFSRWMGKEKGVTMMPNSFFYHKNSPFISESYARLAICKDLNSVKKVCQALRKIRL